MVNPRPIDDNALEASEPLSVDVARDIGQTLIHIYRDRAQQIINTSAPGLTSADSTYTLTNHIINRRWSVTPWITGFGIRALLMNNTDVTARCRIGFIFSATARSSLTFPAADGDWDAVDDYYFASDTLPLSKLVDQNPNFKGDVSIVVWCINDCLIKSLSVWEIPRG